MTFILDASVIVAAFDQSDQQHDAAETLLLDSGESLATLDFARHEVTNVALRLWGSPDEVVPLLEAVERLSEDGGLIASSGSLLARAAEIADRHNLSAYDAAYVAATDRGARQLVSCDVRDLVSQGLAKLPLTSSGADRASPLRMCHPRKKSTEESD